MLPIADRPRERAAGPSGQDAAVPRIVQPVVERGGTSYSQHLDSDDLEEDLLSLFEQLNANDPMQEEEDQQEAEDQHCTASPLQGV